MTNTNNIFKKNYNDQKFTIIHKRLNYINVKEIEYIKNYINNKLHPND